MKKTTDPDSLDSLKRELKNYYRQGVLLSLKGKPSNPYKIYKIVRACRVSEPKITYMRDYISDDAGNVKEIDFRPVKPQKTK